MEPPLPRPMFATDSQQVRQAFPRVCQITGPWTLTRSNTLFFTGLIPKWTIFKSKINIEAQLLQLLLLVLLLLLKLLFLVQKRARRGAVREPTDLQIDPQICGG